MNCTKCGTELRVDNKFCAECGARVETQPDVDTDGREADTQNGSGDIPDYDDGPEADTAAGEPEATADVSQGGSKKPGTRRRKRLLETHQAKSDAKPSKMAGCLLKAGAFYLAAMIISLAVAFGPEMLDGTLDTVTENPSIRWLVEHWYVVVFAIVYPLVIAVVVTVRDDSFSWGAFLWLLVAVPVVLTLYLLRESGSRGGEGALLGGGKGRSTKPKRFYRGQKCCATCECWVGNRAIEYDRIHSLVNDSDGKCGSTVSPWRNKPVRAQHKCLEYAKWSALVR